MRVDECWLTWQFSSTLIHYHELGPNKNESYWEFVKSDYMENLSMFKVNESTQESMKVHSVSGQTQTRAWTLINFHPCWPTTVSVICATILFFNNSSDPWFWPCAHCWSSLYDDSICCDAVLQSARGYSGHGVQWECWRVVHWMYIGWNDTGKRHVSWNRSYPFYTWT